MNVTYYLTIDKVLVHFGSEVRKVSYTTAWSIADVSALESSRSTRTSRVMVKSLPMALFWNMATTASLSSCSTSVAVPQWRTVHTPQQMHTLSPSHLPSSCSAASLHPRSVSSLVAAAALRTVD